MAHDITFASDVESDELVFLFGYFQGIFYQEFNVERFNNGVSGSGGRIKKSRKEVFEILDRVAKMPQITEYPDPTRFSEFYEQLSQTKGTEFIIEFC